MDRVVVRNLRFCFGPLIPWFAYRVGDYLYDVCTLEKFCWHDEGTFDKSLLEEFRKLPTFTIDPAGSEIIVIVWSGWPTKFMFYQYVNGKTVELTPRPGPFECNQRFVETIRTTKSKQNEDKLIEEPVLKDAYDIWKKIMEITKDCNVTDDTYQQILNIII